MIQVRDPAAKVEHEASTSKIGEDQLFYFQQRGIDMEAAVGMIINGFCREVSAPSVVSPLTKLPAIMATASALVWRLLRH